MTRMELWMTGKPISDPMAQCDEKWCQDRRLKEFPFGQFCKLHFFKAPECSALGCENPAFRDRVINPDVLCRLCLFDDRIVIESPYRKYGPGYQMEMEA